MRGHPVWDTVVVVGASSSIGGAILDRFGDSAKRVLGTYSAHAPVVQEGRAEMVHLDLRDNASIEAFSLRLKTVAARIDVVIFLAGLLPGKSLDAYALSEVDEVMSVNFNGQAKVLSRVLPFLTEHTRVLMFSSISAQRGSFDPIYAASKGALLSFVKSMAARLPQGARINAVAPGLIEDSTMFHDMAESRRDFHRSQIPSGHLLRSESLADIVFDLCQAHWSHLNGACIDLNGGQYVR